MGRVPYKKKRHYTTAKQQQHHDDTMKKLRSSTTETNNALRKLLYSRVVKLATPPKQEEMGHKSMEGIIYEDSEIEGTLPRFVDDGSNPDVRFLALAVPNTQSQIGRKDINKALSRLGSSMIYTGMDENNSFDRRSIYTHRQQRIRYIWNPSGGRSLNSRSVPIRKRKKKVTRYTVGVARVVSVRRHNGYLRVQRNEKRVVDAREHDLERVYWGGMAVSDYAASFYAGMLARAREALDIQLSALEDERQPTISIRVGPDGRLKMGLTGGTRRDRSCAQKATRQTTFPTNGTPQLNIA
jgi:hypothetical protein